MDFLEVYRGKTIIYAVLNWGLGHASRSVPIIHQLILNGNKVILYSDGLALDLLKREFPSLEMVHAPSYGVTYKFESIWLNLLYQGNKILKSVGSENKHLKSIVEQISPEIILSDSRFGAYHKDIHSVVITHQVQIYSRMKWLSKIATTYNLKMLNKFRESWIIDDKYHRGAGQISEPEGLTNYSFIGLHSRMQKIEVDYQHDICVVLSGPEPARSRLEIKLIDNLAMLPMKICIVRGTNRKRSAPPKGKNIEITGMLDGAGLNRKMCESRLILCRSGYSSIMDLLKLEKKAILTPTPGQPEQEYLASFHSSSNQFRVIQESELSTELILDAFNQLLN